jgi:hypothetical protein
LLQKGWVKQIDQEKYALTEAGIQEARHFGKR